jgi:hypothetical protein
MEEFKRQEGSWFVALFVFCRRSYRNFIRNEFKSGGQFFASRLFLSQLIVLKHFEAFETNTIEI